MNLTEEQQKIGRRNFLKAVAATPVAASLIWKATSMTPVKAGVIGIGGQGGVLLENCPPTHIRISAVADILPSHLERGLKIAQERHDPYAEGYQDYRRLLERRDLEAVIIASPLWLHGPMTVEALQAGKHVFCEKNMAKTVDECDQMIQAARSARRNLQIGHQRNYNPLYQEAKNLIDNGVIGDVYHVRAVWHRNNDWRRRVPEVEFDPSPWGYPDLEHLTNWRLYNKYSLGLMAELGSHQLQVVNWFFERVPQKVYGTGGVQRFQDGRELPDHVYLIYEYPENLTFSYSSIQSNAWDHYYEAIMGTKGTILLSGERDAMLFYEGGHEPTELRTQTIEADAPVMQASASRALDAAGATVTGDGVSFNALTAYRLELEGFARTIRNGAPNLCDGVEGMNAAVATALGHEAVTQQAALEIPDGLYPEGRAT
ncbi:MAG TPA: Gfo/Idh/MocA family oxidoreductase [Acidobacteriota bacterium]|nr:Gfo/Idh/MocA family oxidoreductase [Acidobacteriota bacterium]